MIVGRFKISCNPDKTDEVMGALSAVVTASRGLPGVIHFDVARDITDPDSFIATEVFTDHAALDLQESQPEVARVMELIGAGALQGAPEWTVYEVVAS